MDSRYNPRGLSPPPRSGGGRRYLADPRASTGTVISSSFDPRDSYHRASIDPSRLSDFAYDPPTSKRTFVDPAHAGGTASRTEYVVPRKDSIAVENRRPVSTILLPPSPDRTTRPVITANRDPRDQRSSRDYREPPLSPIPRSSRPRDHNTTYLTPAVGAPRNHQRHHSATPAEMGRMIVSRGDRDRGDRTGTRYHGSGEHRMSQYQYPPSRTPISIAEEDVSYTGPREQFARDYPQKDYVQKEYPQKEYSQKDYLQKEYPQREHPQRRPRGDSYTRPERPVSVMGPPDWKPSRERRDPRELGPPPSASRQFERLDRPDTSRRLGHESDSDREKPRRRNSTRNPVVHQSKDEDYERRPAARHPKDRYEDDGRYLREKDYERLDKPADPRRTPRSRETSPTDTGARRIPRSRESSPEHRSGISKGLAAVGIGGLAAAGLTGAKHRDGRDKPDDAEDSDSDRRKERRRRKHRNRDPEENGDKLVEPGRQAERSIPEEKTNGKVDEHEDDGHRHRRHRRRRHRHRDENDQDVASESSSDKPVQFSTTEENVPRGREESDDSDAEPKRREPKTEILPTGLEQRTRSPGEDEDNRTRRVALVEPPKEEERPKPKGILKQRLVPFPEDPNPHREGVAPLKEAGKNGVPEGARWTKINRILVNPEALEKSKERFEERDDYVIVLRVLTKEEIEKLAEKTREIRESREEKWKAEVARKTPHEGRRSREDYSSDDEQERKPALAIEAPQASTPEQWQPNYQKSREQAERTVPEISIPGTSGLNLVPETYSTNV